VASALPYDIDPRSGLNELAVKIAGHNRFGSVREEHWAALAEKSDLNPDRAVAVVRHVAEALPDALSDALKSEDMPPEAQDLGARMLPKVSAFCQGN
jgi:hypothetical protein